MSQQVKYGKINFSVNDATSLGKFVLEQNVNVSYTPFQVFNFHAFKQTARGSKIIEADVFGYVFVNPFTGIINNALYKENNYPEPKDFKESIYRECMKITNANAFEDKPIVETGTSPNMIPTEKLLQKAFNWLTQTLVIKKIYVQPTKGLSGRSTRVDTGIREVVVTFKKKDFMEFGSLGVFAIPSLDLTYKHPNSTKTFKRRVLGYSGEIINDEIKCSKAKMLGKGCENFPDNVCSVCGNLICYEHQKQCEKCGTILCKDCVVSKGIVSKHYFCPKC